MLSPLDLTYLQGLFKQETGIHLGEEKRYLFETRLFEECQRRNQTPVYFLDQLRRRQEEAVRDFVSALTTHETFFFRELALFELLQTEIIPEQLQRLSPQRRLRIWSAGCSSGQEPYSLAMLMRTMFPQLDSRAVDFLATDVSDRSVERARSGLFHQAEVNRGLPVTKLLRYFRQQGQDWQICDDIRQRIRFERQNLLHTSTDQGEFDLILCRNVLIYFDQLTKRRIIRLLRERLHPEGYLLVGGSEHSSAISDEFVPVARGSVVVYRPRRGPRPADTQSSEINLSKGKENQSRHAGH